MPASPPTRSGPGVPPSGPATGRAAGEPPASPTPRRVRRPRWLDVRVVLGVVLVVGSVLLGAVVIARANHTEPVWSLTRDLQAGATLTAGDVAPADVRLGAGVDGYVPAAEAVVGRRLTRSLARGELLPRAAVPDTAAPADLLTVAVPFAATDVPAIARGDRLTVWVSTRRCPSVRILDDVAVDDVTRPGSGLGSSDTVDVVLSLPPELADRVVTALALDGATLRAGVLSGASASPSGAAATPAAPVDLSGCGAAAATATRSATPTPTPTPS